MNLDRLWKECLSDIRKSVPSESYKTWFEPTALKKIEGADAVLYTSKGDIHANFIEEKYGELLRDLLSKKTGRELKIRFDAGSKTPAPASPAVQISGTPLNREYSFDNFIVGQSNEFANSAAFAVSESPGATRFNPLFIYGKSGLGKTHLLQAIGNHVSGKSPDKIVVYINSTHFMEQYIKSIEIKKMGYFNEYYKKCYVLLIDDIQFLAGKQGTQETFFHIFNSLYSESRQIVITSDKAPKELDGLEDRLVSRFQSGLTVDIQPPNLETKIAIINKKAENNRLNLPEDVIEFIASISSSNIREMEGHLLRLLAYSSINKIDIDYAKAVEILDMTKDAYKKRIYVEEVIDEVAKYFKISKEKIIKGSREKEIVVPRQLAMFLSRKLTESSLKNIGKIFMKDHSTVVHGFQTIEKQLLNNVHIKTAAEAVSKTLLNR